MEQELNVGTNLHSHLDPEVVFLLSLFAVPLLSFTKCQVAAA